VTSDPSALLDRTRRSPTTSSEPDEAPVYVEGFLQQSTMGDSALAALVAAAFLEDLPRQLVAFEGHLEAGDAEGAGRQAHTLRGAAGVVGAEALARAAYRLETLGGAGELAALREGLPALVREAARICEAMEAARARNAQTGANRAEAKP
jgi:HPt (histidine-containing phosphotransfer) domain-containing protein